MSVPQRLKYPYFKEFPWENEKMILPERLNIEPEYKVHEVSIQLLQTFPSHEVDRIKTFDLLENFSQSPGEYGWGFERALGVNTTHNIRENAAHKGAALACSYMAAYRILDIMHHLKEPTTDSEVGTSLEQLTVDLGAHWPIISHPLTKKLIFLDKINEWPSFFRKFSTIFTGGQITSGNLLEYASFGLASTFLRLSGAQQYSTICLNWTMVVLHLRAILQGIVWEGVPDLPNSIEHIKKIMNQISGENVDIRWPSGAGLKMGLHMATMISPLILLIPIRYDNLNIHRSIILDLAVRPIIHRSALIRRIESVIWKALFGLAKLAFPTAGDIHTTLNNIIANPDFQKACAIEVPRNDTDEQIPENIKEALMGLIGHEQHEDGASEVDRTQVSRQTEDGQVDRDVDMVEAEGDEVDETNHHQLASNIQSTMALSLKRKHSSVDSAEDQDVDGSQPRDMSPCKKVPKNGTSPSLAETGKGAHDEQDDNSEGSHDDESDDSESDDSESDDAATENYARENMKALTAAIAKTFAEPADAAQSLQLPGSDMPKKGEQTAIVRDVTAPGYTDVSTESILTTAEASQKMTGKKAFSRKLVETTKPKKHNHAGADSSESNSDDDGDEGMGDLEPPRIPSPGQVSTTITSVPNSWCEQDQEMLDLELVTDRNKDSDSEDEEMADPEPQPAISISKKALVRRTTAPGLKGSKKPSTKNEAAPKSTSESDSEDGSDKDEEMADLPAITSKKASVRRTMAARKNRSKAVMAAVQKGSQTGRGKGEKKDADENQGDDDPCKDENEGLWEFLADGIWLDARTCNLDLTPHPKINSEYEVYAYGPRKEKKCKFTPNVHTQDIHDAIVNLAAAVERCYADGLPLHCHDVHKNKSVFHVMSKDDFSSASDKEIQDIFSQKHIVVQAEPPKEQRFGHALKSLGGFRGRMLEVQDQSLLADEDRNSIMRRCTVQNLIDQADSVAGNVINALDFPLALESMAPTPFSSDAHALLHAVGNLRWQKPQTFPTGHFRWGLAATSGAFHGLHIDSNGLATFVSPVTGSKWWIMASPIGEDTRKLEDVGILLDKSFDVLGSCDGLLSFEAILLEPGTTLYMRPNTLHAVYTPTSSVVRGGHFLATSTMRDTLVGVFHTFTLNRLITNTDHPPAWDAIRTLVEFYHQFLVKEEMDEDDPASSHIPNLHTFDGLISLLSICSLGRLLSIVDIRTYVPAREDSGAKLSWIKYDNTSLPLMDRLKNQYTRGLCAELIEWADRRISLKYADSGRQGPSIADLDRQLFGRHVNLLQHYKDFADKENQEHADGLTAANLDRQLNAIRKKYQIPGRDTTAKQISDLSTAERMFFPTFETMDVIFDVATPAERRLHMDDTVAAFKSLMTAGMTERDIAHQGFRDTKTE